MENIIVFENLVRTYIASTIKDRPPTEEELQNACIMMRGMFSELTNQMKTLEGITEQLKIDNQMEWVRRMNNIRHRATEIVNNELIYV